METDAAKIPNVCQFASLNLKDDKRVRDEQLDWILKDQKLPVWSRLLDTNCVGHPRDMIFNKKGDYNIEIPSRLWSLWGNLADTTPIAKQFAELYNYESVCCVLALCSALKYNLNDWTSDLLDSIYIQGFKFYQDLLAKLNVNNLSFQKKNLCTSYSFQNTLFKVTLEQVATGYVYIPYGYNEYNIARAITYFFNNYQFGIICCNSKTLAIGFCVDIDDGYFMFDCQSKGGPLFPNNDTTAYILRCNHLQILLYCIVVTLNVAKYNTNFIIYNVDINIDDTIDLSPKVKPWKKKLTTNLPFKKEQQKSQTHHQATKYKREALQKIRNNIAFGLSGPTNVKVSAKAQEKQTDKAKLQGNDKEKHQEKNKDPEKMSDKFVKQVENDKEKQMTSELKQNLEKKKESIVSTNNNKESQAKSNVLLKTPNQNTKDSKQLTNASSLHAMPMNSQVSPKILKTGITKADTKGNYTNANANANAKSMNSTSEGEEKDQKVYLVETTSKSQITPNKTVNPRIIVVNQLSELMDK